MKELNELSMYRHVVLVMLLLILVQVQVQVQVLMLVLVLVLVLVLMSPLGILHNLQHLPDQYEVNERLLHKCQQFLSSWQMKGTIPAFHATIFSNSPNWRYPSCNMCNIWPQGNVKTLNCESTRQATACLPTP
ncbi:hypothetical protein [Paenibacillus sp. FSL R7-0337]|uniref:hypothetical protein n=1 Tax=Paenibacillus sp. FSL R7-0337 TaxID=1926588 RepID=UPI0015C3433C|nr:hypothetical protein [Paenibacillus sp. FSL R7-0337]